MQAIFPLAARGILYGEARTARLLWPTLAEGRKTMTVPGYVDYRRREYCKDIRCAIQRQLDKCDEGSDEYEQVRGICKTRCIHTTYEFHHWLIEHGYEIVRPE